MLSDLSQCPMITKFSLKSSIQPTGVAWLGWWQPDTPELWISMFVGVAREPQSQSGEFDSRLHLEAGKNSVKPLHLDFCSCLLMFINGYQVINDCFWCLWMLRMAWLRRPATEHPKVRPRHLASPRDPWPWCATKDPWGKISRADCEILYTIYIYIYLI